MKPFGLHHLTGMILFRDRPKGVKPDSLCVREMRKTARLRLGHNDED